MLKLKIQYFCRLMWITDSLDPDAGKDRRQEEKRMTEDEMIGWHHQLNGHHLSKVWEMVKDRKPGVLQSTESHRVGNYWATEQQQRDFFFQIYQESWFPSPVLANLLKVFLKVTSFYVNQYYIKKMIRLYFYECSFCFRYRIYSLLFVISAAQCPLLQITYDWDEFLLLLLCPCKVLTISIVILCALLMI